MSEEAAPSREDILRWLALASTRGFLGLFVGTGFSRTATSDRAHTFEELLQAVADRLKLPTDFGIAPFLRMSFPQIASKLLALYLEPGTPSHTADRFKEEVAHLCSFLPDAELRAVLTDALGAVRPSWIVTTNYDLVLEALLSDSDSLLPSQPLIPNAERVPIYHIHGHRHAPGSIRITEDDYVGLLGPIDYQRLRLPLLLAESTTLMLGYALGDINVRAAMEWSRSFRGAGGLESRPPRGRVIHAVRAQSPREEPYRGPNGATIVEIADLMSFLAELGRECRQTVVASATVSASIRAFLNNPANATAVPTSEETRNQFLGIVSLVEPGQSTLVVNFLERVLDPLWARAREDFGWDYYDAYLRVLIETLEVFPYRYANPTVTGYLAEALDRAGWAIDPRKSKGSAWAATDRWLRDHGRIPADLKSELNAYARSYSRVNLLHMLRMVVPSGAAC